MAKRICGRSLTAGPGSCHAWWESCPATTRHCFMRFIREQNAQGVEVDMPLARQWEAARDKTRDPAPRLI